METEVRGAAKRATQPYQPIRWWLTACEAQITLLHQLFYLYHSVLLKAAPPLPHLPLELLLPTQEERLLLPLHVSGIEAGAQIALACGLGSH